MNTLKNLEIEIEKIKLRNKKVEMDKAWEVSIERKIIVALLTYVVMVIFMTSIDIVKPFLNAIIPTVGFMLSTLTLNFFKERWIKKRNIK